MTDRQSKKRALNDRDIWHVSGWRRGKAAAEAAQAKMLTSEEVEKEIEKGKDK